MSTLTRDEARAYLRAMTPETEMRIRPEDLGALVEYAGMAPPSDRPPRKMRRWTIALLSLEPYRSKLESDYADSLMTLMAAGIVMAWAYEPDTLVCAGGTKYTPDFLVRYNDKRPREYHEIKGYLRAKDAVRMREAAAVSAYDIVVIQRRKGAWVETRRYRAGQPERRDDQSA